MSEEVRVAELPNDAVEALCKTVGHTLATHPRITGSALAALANADGDTAVELRERVLTVIAGAAYPLIAARVRAEAVADGEQRLAAIRVLAEAAKASVPHAPYTGVSWQRLLEVLDAPTAGSVPVATPDDDGEPLTHEEVVACLADARGEPDWVAPTGGGSCTE